MKNSTWGYYLGRANTIDKVFQMRKQNNEESKITEIFIKQLRIYIIDKVISDVKGEIDNATR